jgi:hypothetical protein
MSPNFSPPSQIVGHFPPANPVYQDGDLFRATVTCVQAVQCDVDITLATVIEADATPEPFYTFSVDWQNEGGVEVSEPLPYAGFPIQLYITVDDGMNSGSDTIVWIDPRIERPAM